MPRVRGARAVDVSRRNSAALLSVGRIRLEGREAQEAADAAQRHRRDGHRGREPRLEEGRHQQVGDQAGDHEV